MIWYSPEEKDFPKNCSFLVKEKYGNFIQYNVVSDSGIDITNGSRILYDNHSYEVNQKYIEKWCEIPKEN